MFQPNSEVKTATEAANIPAAVWPARRDDCYERKASVAKYTWTYMHCAGYTRDFVNGFAIGILVAAAWNCADCFRTVSFKTLLLTCHKARVVLIDCSIKTDSRGDAQWIQFQIKQNLIAMTE